MWLLVKTVATSTLGCWDQHVLRWCQPWKRVAVQPKKLLLTASLESLYCLGVLWYQVGDFKLRKLESKRKKKEKIRRKAGIRKRIREKEERFSCQIRARYPMPCLATSLMFLYLVKNSVFTYQSVFPKKKPEKTHVVLTNYKTVPVYEFQVRPMPIPTYDFSCLE